MSDLLQSIADGWTWRIGKPVEVVATNRFGNAIVRNEEGEFFRIVPEELRCEFLATSNADLEEKRREEEFSRDWEMVRIVQLAERELGALSEGEAYCLKIPAVLGGPYSVTNYGKVPLLELLGSSGSLAQQLDGVPDGETVMIVPEERESNQPVETTQAVARPARLT